MMSRRFFSLLPILLSICLVSAAMAQEAPPSALIGTPVYDPQAKRYFEVVRLGVGEHSTWTGSARDVGTLVYEGVHGRLAIIDSLEVHEFLLRTFHLGIYNPAWIGLRYLCSKKQLQWVDGRLWKPGEFQAWNTPFTQDPFFCSGVNDPSDWAGVHYTPPPNFMWMATGSGKGFEFAIVEFPTGKP